MQRTPLYALLVANSVSLVGNQFTIVALPWFVLQTTGSAAKTGLTGFAVALPYFLVGIFGGALVDRFGYRNTSIVADVVSGSAIAAVPLLYHSVGLAFWQLLLLVFFSSFLSIPGLSARRALLPEIAKDSGIRLERINSAFETVYPVSALLGPPIAGILVVAIGASNVLWIDSATFAVSAALVFVGVSEMRRSTASQRARYVDDLMEGIHFLRQDRLLLAMALSLTISNFLMGPLFGVILPVYADRVFGSARDLGFMLSAFGAGQVGGSIAYGVVGDRLPRRLIWVAGFLGVVVPFWTLVWSPGLSIILLMMVLAALTDGPLGPMSVTIRHERTPAALRGRVFSTFSAVSTMAVPLGMAAAGLLISALGLTAAMVVLGAGSIALLVATLLVPSFREMDKRAAMQPADLFESDVPVG